MQHDIVITTCYIDMIDDVPLYNAYVDLRRDLIKIFEGTSMAEATSAAVQWVQQEYGPDTPITYA